MKLAVSLVFFMLAQHVLSAPTHPPPSSPQAQAGPPRRFVYETPNKNLVGPQPLHGTSKTHANRLEEQVKPTRGCSAAGCAHIDVGQLAGGFAEHLRSTHFTASSNQGKSLTISVLLSENSEFL